MTQGRLGRRSFLFGAAMLPAGALAGGIAPTALSFATPSPSHPNAVNTLRMGQPVAPSLLADARRSRRYFGAAVRMDQIAAQPVLRELIIQNCGSMTPEIHLKWNSLEWMPGEFNYDPVDNLIAFGRSNGIAVRGHTLVWERSTPDWARATMLAHRDWSVVEGHFARTLGRYADDVHEWDVVNEPIDTESGVDGLRRTCFHTAFGPDYIVRALELARRHAPDARLLINDYGFDYTNPVDAARRKAFVKLLTDLKLRGAPLDGVGLQAHLDLSKGPLAADDLRRFIRTIVELGLDVTITELDVKEQKRPVSLAQRDQKVADAAERYLDVVLAEEGVRGVSTWGISDRFSWLSEGDGNGGPAAPGEITPVNRGLPYDADYQRKPLYWALRRSLDACARSGFAYTPSGSRPRPV